MGLEKQVSLNTRCLETYRVGCIFGSQHHPLVPSHCICFSILNSILRNSVLQSSSSCTEDQHQKYYLYVVMRQYFQKWSHGGGIQCTCRYNGTGMVSLKTPDAPSEARL